MCERERERIRKMEYVWVYVIFIHLRLQRYVPCIQRNRERELVHVCVKERD